MKKAVWWCENCQVPLLAPVCELCGKTVEHPFAKDITPVFSEEMSLLRHQVRFQELPKKSRDFYFWCSGNYYYRFGRKTARLSFRGSAFPSIEVIDTKPLRMRPRNKHRDLLYRERIRLANRSHLMELEYEATSFIQSMTKAHPDCTFVVPFSGGKDSTVVSMLARRALRRSDILHVFGDTGIESPDTLAFIKDFQEENPRIPLLHARPNVDFFELCKLLGPPSRIKRWCCSTQKTFPISVVYGILSRTSQVMSLCGVRHSESVQRQTHQRIVANTKIAGEIMICPILHWTDAEVWLYLLSNNQAFNHAYKRGFRRVGCIYCPYLSKRSEFLKSVFLPRETRAWANLVNKYYRLRTDTKTLGPGTARWKSRAGGLSHADDRGKVDITPCESDPSSFSIVTANPISHEFLEYLRPFGKVRVEYDDGLVCQAQIFSAANTPLFSVRLSKPRRHMRFTIYTDKNMRITSQRIIRQVRKSSACVLCGACQMVCPVNAITCNDRYAIDPEKCTHCMMCVTKVKGGCIAAHATSVTGSR